jgi:hypothetical protein
MRLRTSSGLRRHAVIPQTFERSPCDDCRYREKCAGERLACEAFGMFLHDLSEVRWRTAPRVPTRELYQALVGDA